MLIECLQKGLRQGPLYGLEVGKEELILYALADESALSVK